MLAFLLLAQATSGALPAPTTGGVLFRNNPRGVTAAANLFMLPPKVPSCRNEQEEQIALQQRHSGQPEQCLLSWRAEARDHHR